MRTRPRPRRSMVRIYPYGAPLDSVSLHGDGTVASERSLCLGTESIWVVLI